MRVWDGLAAEVFMRVHKRQRFTSSWAWRSAKSSLSRSLLAPAEPAFFLAAILLRLLEDDTSLHALRESKAQRSTARLRVMLRRYSRSSYHAALQRWMPCCYAGSTVAALSQGQKGIA